MDVQHTISIMFLAVAVLPGCTPPEIDPPEFDGSGTSDGGSDEFDSAQEEDESGGGEGGGELSHNACVLEPDSGGKYGYRHHCGGFMTFKNCKADAVQQMCSAMGQWLIKLAEDYPLAKGALYGRGGPRQQGQPDRL